MTFFKHDANKINCLSLLTVELGEGRCWSRTEDQWLEIVSSGLAYFGRSGDGAPSFKQYLKDAAPIVPNTWWLHEETGHTDEAKKEIHSLFGKTLAFDTPKPERLLKRIVHIASNPGDLVMDSFAGSGTTGAVAHKMNRRWIMVELGDHCKTHIVPRLKKVVDGEDQGGISKTVNWQGGGGYKFYRLAESLLKKDTWGNWVINPEYNGEMLAEAMCKHMGYRYEPRQEAFWLHGQSTENNFIYITTGTLSHDQLKLISEEVGEGRSLLICEEARKMGASKDLNKPEVRQKIVSRVQHRTQVNQQQSLPGISDIDSVERITEIVNVVSEKITKLTIDVPQIVVLPTREVNYGFNDFDLQQLDAINYPVVSEALLLQHLEGNQERYSIHFGEEQVHEARLEDYLVRRLMDRNEIDYDSHADLLYKLAGQVVGHLKCQQQDDEAKIRNILIYYGKQICEYIWVQMESNLWTTPTDYQGKVVQGFDVLEPNIFTMSGDEKRRDFRAPVTNKQAVKKMVFTGFKRCCYPDQKFDSIEGELMLSRVLEDDDSVLKWMKPAPGKFKIEYQSGKWYEPDFIVETNDKCLMIEAKRETEMNDPVVKAKEKAALQWCHFANKHAADIDGKRWVYLLIPNDEILANSSVAGLSAKFGVNNIREK